MLIAPIVPLPTVMLENPSVKLLEKKLEARLSVPVLPVPIPIPPPVVAGVTVSVVPDSEALIISASTARVIFVADTALLMAKVPVVPSVVLPDVVRPTVLTVPMA